MKVVGGGESKVSGARGGVPGAKPKLPFVILKYTEHNIAG